ncbi:MAG: mechanosensitive ion channel family protein [Candidatus Woesearchaeota archaeon]
MANRTAVEIVESFGWSVPEALQVVVLGNSVLNYLFAIGIFAVMTLVLWFFRTVALKRLKAFSLRTRTDIDNAIVAAIEKLGVPFYFVWSLLAALTYLDLAAWLEAAVSLAWWIIGGFYLIRVALTIVDYVLGKATHKARESEEMDDAIVELLGKLIKGVVWILALLFVLSNYGVNITGLLAGAGIAGLALAFALQQVLSDIFASFSIYLDKPFRRGDFIIVGTDMGVVEHIGVKSTRMRTLQGQELVISNRELTSVRVNNFKNLERRRVVKEIGVTYDTPARKLEKIPKIIETIIDEVDDVDFDRAHFKDFGASSLDFEYVFFVKTGDFTLFMDAQEKINLGLVKAFKKEKIEFAYPTQTLYVHNE